MRVIVLAGFALTGCTIATVGERNELCAPVRAIQHIHKEEAMYYSMYARYTDLAPRRIEAYEITTTAAQSGYRVVAKPTKNDYRTLYSDETMAIRMDDAR